MEFEPGRATGKTTRAVDGAIQTLFNDGEITIPLNEKEYRDAINKNIMLDDESIKNIHFESQRYFLDRVIQRLKYEHRLDSRDDIKVKGNKIQIIKK